MYQVANRIVVMDKGMGSRVVRYRREKKKEQKTERIVQIYGLPETWQHTTTSDSHPPIFVRNPRYDTYQYKTGFR